MAIIDVQPSEAISSLLSAVSLQPSMTEGMTAARTRESAFPNALAASLVGVAIDPAARRFADDYLDNYWATGVRRANLLDTANAEREVIIGSGFHAAAYASTRVQAGFPRPLVLERGDRVGGTFALTGWPTWYLNSRNQPGNPGLAGDLNANLNYLPGGPIQTSDVTMLEFPTNADMGFVIRVALAQNADVVTGATVTRVIRSDDGTGVAITLDDGRVISAGRVIDARGLGDPSDVTLANGETVITFPQFMRRMASPWPLRGVRRAAVIGGGDSARCAIESFLGIAPQPFMAAIGVDAVERVDVYAPDFATTRERWQETNRGRYQPIGRYLRADRFGVKRLNVVQRRVTPTALPTGALVDGRTYDLVVVCTGNGEGNVRGLELNNFDTYTVNGEAVAQRHYNLPAFRVGPHARLSFSAEERSTGIADIPQNAVSMFRTGTKTAQLAATLPAIEV